MPPNIGRALPRLEDARFLIGRGRFVADVAVEALSAHVVRSSHAHAVLERIDVSPAAAIAGVHGVYTAADLLADGLGPLPCMAQRNPLVVPPPHGLASRPP